MKRRALGKGLRSLIPEAPQRAPVPIPEGDDPRQAAAARVLELIDIDLIVPNRQQPRREFDDAALDELASSLKSKGVIQPIVVRADENGKFELVVGERRWRAAQRAGLLKIPAIVRDVAEDQLLEIALIENVQREDLNPIDEALAYRMLINDLGLTQQEVAERVGKQRATITNTLRLLTLSEPVQEMVRNGEITMGHAKALVALEGKENQEEAAKRIAKDGMSVRQAERVVAWFVDQKPAEKKKKPAPHRDPNLVAAEENLQKTLGTKVRIIQGRKGGGRIELHFFSQEEMSRVYDLILDSSKRPVH
jgi:ParB family chromosome partitioning protein